jgi:hypothetical protein
MRDATPKHVSAAHRALAGVLVLAPSIMLCAVALRQMWLATMSRLGGCRRLGRILVLQRRGRAMSDHLLVSRMALA